MNPWLILTALVFAVAVVFVARAVRPGGGARRAPGPLLPPSEPLPKFEARCVAERRDTLHVRYGAGAVQCLECRNPSGGAQ